MSSANVLLMLPTSLGCGLLSQWLTPTAVAALDTAHCSRVDRPPLLELLRSLELPGEFLFPQSSRQLLWMWKRRIKCSTFIYYSAHLSRHVDMATVVDLVKLSARSIKSVNLCGDHATMKVLAEVIAKGRCTLTDFSLRTTDTNANDGKKSGVSPITAIVTNSAETLIEYRVSSIAKFVPSLAPNTKLPVLQTIDLFECTDAYLQTFCRAAPNLREIMLSSPSCTDKGLAAIGQHCPKLESLSCTHAFNIRRIDAGIAAIAKGCPSLKRINLEACHQLTATGFTAIITHYTQLEELSVQNHTKMTDACLLDLANSACTKTLKLLNVQNCSRITGAAILAIATQCKALHSLDVGHCEMITGEDMMQIVPQLGSVDSLYVAGLPVDDEILQLIAEHMPLLEDLDISTHVEGDVEYSCTGLVYIAERCEKLKNLFLGADCDDVVSELAEAVWMKLRPELEIHREEYF